MPKGIYTRHPEAEVRRITALRMAVTTHGESGGDTGETRTSEYEAWQGARATGCVKRWDDYQTFFADMGRRPPEYALVRRNKSSLHGPRNSRWAPRVEAQLGKSDARPVTIHGETRQMIEWCREIGIAKSTMHWRLRSWPEGRWLDPPVPRGRRGA